MGVELYPSLADKAAALLVGLSRNHPFVDGNKRTAIGAVSVFLLANGYRAHPNPGCSRGLNPPVSSRDLAM
ncbi:type II toxin-antitoxin system death-on-curing family toxin [Kocuria sp. BT304]|uniref:type II toxin-antitoxin system death-on-curing family toxin n=1 Tax=Kocuria sp. BT304 TaxID=1702043 RepID=UPI000DD39155|nr:type II toxin-antitoxin system death-on-curing family toxin [Kocuria sp. BT304]